MPEGPIVVNGLPWEAYRDKTLDKLFWTTANSVDDELIRVA